VIGREQEIERLIHILLRRNKNNPVLIGEPGVGKTAIVEGLAKRIVEGDVPDALKRKKILSLDLTLLIAGTIYRGEFESRLKHIIDEVAHSPDTMLFIDEIHNIIGAGSNQGTMDAANILKPALARGQLRCIGATTHDEYAKHLKSDAALERRFQSVVVDEPSEADAIAILTGLKTYYDTFHHVNITSEAIEAAVSMSQKYIHDNYLPDKAIDLIDEAAASLRMTQKDTPAQKKLHELKQKLETCTEDKKRAIREERFDDALTLKQAEQALEKSIKQAKKARKAEPKKRKKNVTKKEIAHVLSIRIGVDSDALLKDQWQQLDSVQKTLKDQVIGQDSAITTTMDALRQAYVGLKSPNKPLASLLFVGPSGVGKTALARALATELFHDAKALVRLDMSEFSEAHGVSKLLGSPAGYVGHKERNKFIDQLHKRPYAVVLFDEIDKAHPDVMRLLFQILDEGTLTDSTGKKVHFNHALIILTSNVGAEFYKSHGIGFGKEKASSTMTAELKTALQAKIKEEFGPALTGRLSNTCYFTPLSDKDIERIIKQQIDFINKNMLAARKVRVRSDKSAITELARIADTADFGARNVEHIIRNTLATLLSEVYSKKERKSSFRLKHTDGHFELV